MVGFLCIGYRFRVYSSRTHLPRFRFRENTIHWSQCRGEALRAPGVTICIVPGGTSQVKM